MKSIIEFQRHLISVGIIYIIISKFSYKKESDRFILFVIDKNLEIGFYSIVLCFSFDISLWIKKSYEPLLDFMEIV